jgi:hypothetical protein
MLAKQIMLAKQLTCAYTLALVAFIGTSVSATAQVAEQQETIAQPKHNVEIVGPHGPRGHALKTYYNCWSSGCEFVSEDKLQQSWRRIMIFDATGMRPR